MKRLSHRLCLATLAACGLLSTATPASAAAFYSGGATLPFTLYYDAWFREFNGGTAFPSCNPATRTCIAYVSFGSGGGVAAFLNQQSPGVAWDSGNMSIPPMTRPTAGASAPSSGISPAATPS